VFCVMGVDLHRMHAAGSWSPERKWKTVSVDQSGTVATKPKDDFGYVQTTEMVSKGVRTW